MAELALYSPDKRVKFTIPSAQDDENIGKLRSDPICRKYNRHLPESVTTEQITKFREHRAGNPANLDFVVSTLEEDGSWKFAGVCNVFVIDATHMWGDAGIWVCSDRHGQGLTTPILYMLLEHVIELRKLHRVSFMTGADNAPMRGWLEKVAGIRQEGTFKDCWRNPAGGWVDVASYGVTEVEWIETVKPALEKKMKEKGLGMAKDA